MMITENNIVEYMKGFFFFEKIYTEGHLSGSVG